MTTYVVNTPVIGVDLNNSYATTVFPTNTSGGVLPPHKLGTCVNGNNSTEWIYVQASGAISAGDLVTISTSFGATRAIGATVALGPEIAFAQNAFNDTDFGWVAKKGDPLTVFLSATAALNVALYVATTSGKLSTVTASGSLVGIALVSTMTTAVTTLVSAVVTWPKYLT